MADEPVVDPVVDTAIEPVVEPVIEEVTVEPQLGTDPTDLTLISLPDNGSLVVNAGRLLWVSPNGTRTIIAGA